MRAHVTRDMPRNVVAIGKCAGALLDGAASVLEIEHAFVAIPQGYPPPSVDRGDSSSPHSLQIHIGGHPQMTRASFEAGRFRRQ